MIPKLGRAQHILQFLSQLLEWEKRTKDEGRKPTDISIPCSPHTSLSLTLEANDTGQLPTLQVLSYEL